jgi:chemotaxis protein MotB
MLEQPDEPKAGAPDWMVTFADLMSLLLTFFVLLLSFANMEVVKFKSAVGSIQNALGLKSVFELSDTPSGKEILEHENENEGSGEAEVQQQIVDELERILQQAGLEGSGTAKVGKRGVVLQLQGDLLFASGEAAISSKALPVLDALSAYVASQSRFVDIIGHTDDVPIATAVYPSNWELSAARAGQAVRYLSEKGVKPFRMRAIGQAHTVPVSENSTLEGRANNRRVEFVFVADVETPESANLEELSQSADSSDGAAKQ